MRIAEAIEILGLKKPVTHAEIKTRYRRLAKEYHPDRFKPGEQSEGISDNFIRIKDAAELLLRNDEAYINSSRAYRDPEPVLKRPAYRKPPPPPVTKLRFIRELDNLVRFIRMIFGIKKKDPDINFSFQPGAWLGRYYELLFERQFSSEIKLHGFAFAIWRFFRIVSGALFLIAGFLLMSIAGMVIAALIFPPLIVFLGIYHIYCEMLDQRAKTLNKQVRKNDRDAWFNARRQFLHVRTIPVFALLILGSSLVRISRDASWYFNTLSIIFCLPVLILAFSVMYEWIHYYRSRKAS
ncbi:MAG: DnaJ domain-containing protein [Bacteroidetes bacterium]|nr:DnaJ domain-containing protein [Bacteroidota bacterium]